MEKHGFPHVLVPGWSAVDPAAADHRRDDLDVAQLVHRDRDRVAVEDDEIGEVAGQQLPPPSLVARQPRRGDRRGVERLLERQRLVRQPRATVVDRAQDPRPDSRERVELLDRGVACSVQFSHAPSDRDLAERFWGERLAGTYAFRSLVDSGAVVANGSDAPVEELDPLAGIRAGVLRTIDDRPAWRPDEALTVGQALHASTVAPAWLTGDERRRGKLLPGYLADLVVLDRDPVAIPVDELPDVQVVATMVGGRWVHGAPPWD